MQKKQPAARRIKLRYDFLKAERMEKTVNDFTEFTNSRVIPLMEALGLEVTKESVLKYADNSDLMRFDYIQKEVKTSGIDNKYLLNMVEDTARRKFVELFGKEPRRFVIIEHAMERLFSHRQRNFLPYVCWNWCPFGGVAPIIDGAGGQQEQENQQT